MHIDPEINNKYLGENRIFQTHKFNVDALGSYKKSNSLSYQPGKTRTKEIAHGDYALMALHTHPKKQMHCFPFIITAQVLSSRSSVLLNNDWRDMWSGMWLQFLLYLWHTKDTSHEPITSVSFVFQSSDAMRCLKKAFDIHQHLPRKCAVLVHTYIIQIVLNQLHP